MNRLTDKPLVETHELLAALGQENLRVVDATWWMPGSDRNARAEFEARHLPGAVFFDIDAIADPNSDLPHMLPSPQGFADHMGAMGIHPQHEVVVYDTHGLMSAARAWWMFRVFGHTQVAILNGGLPQWLAEGLPTESGQPVPRLTQYEPRYQPQLVASQAQVVETLTTGQVLDLRPAERFWGRQPEPRPGVRPGHMPGSRNLPWAQILSPQDQTVLPGPELALRFQAAGIDVTQPVICSCGSGVTACIGAFALYLLGNTTAAVYDGSWAEWGSSESLPVVSADLSS